VSVDIASRLRRCLLGVLLVGLLGSGTELVLLKHYGDLWQLAPLVLIGSALALVAWHAMRPAKAALRALQFTMVLFVLASGAGMALHYGGAAEFQVSIDPSLSAWELAKKVLRGQSPPVLAPGVMLQLGLIGLVYAYRHPIILSGTPSRGSK
jgi:hypothetical protein